MTTPTKQRKKQFVLYDGRAKSGLEDDAFEASAMCTAESEKEAWEDSKDFEEIDAVWWEYDLIGDEIKNGKMRLDIGKGVLL